MSLNDKSSYSFNICIKFKWKFKPQNIKKTKNNNNITNWKCIFNKFASGAYAEIQPKKKFENPLNLCFEVLKYYTSKDYYSKICGRKSFPETTDHSQ